MVKRTRTPLLRIRDLFEGALLAPRGYMLHGMRTPLKVQRHPSFDCWSLYDSEGRKVTNLSSYDVKYYKFAMGGPW